MAGTQSAKTATEAIQPKRKLKLAKEVFVLPHEERFLVYAPLSRRLSIINEAHLRQLKNFVLTPENISKETENSLEEIGLLVEQEIRPSEEYTPFFPTQLTLFPTSNCQLRCIYCYGNGGDTKNDLILSTARAGIDLVVENALKSNQRNPFLWYHGGGEPTFRWKFLTETAEYFIEKATMNNLKPNISLSTNGMLNLKQVDWIIQNLRRVQLSIDGPEDIQNRQRPLENGQGSFGLVYKTAKRFSEKGYPFDIRTTITDDSVNRLKEIYEFFQREFKPRTINFEPLYECGRCHTSKSKEPDYQEYVANFIGLIKSIPPEKRDLVATSASGNLKGIKTAFCGAAGKNFCITPEGYISSCYEVSLKSDPRSEIFFYGKFDPDIGQFIIDEEKRRHLFERQTANLHGCQDCFTKWNCGGDCLVKTGSSNIYETNRPFDKGHKRCALNRLMAQSLLIEKINGGL